MLDRRITEAECQGDRQHVLSYKVARRTAFVTLTVMGDRNAAREYVLSLLNDPEEASINRAFYLVYYGDRPAFVMPEEKGLVQSTLEACYLDDQANTSYRSTLNTLLSSLVRDRENLDQGRTRKPDFQLRLTTLCSFTRSRHQDDLYRFGTDGVYVLEYLEKALADDDPKRRGEGKELLPELRIEIETMLRGTTRRNDGLWQKILDLYTLKRRPHRGWVKRRVGASGRGPNGVDMAHDGAKLFPADRVESVSDHSHFAMLLAYHLLPEEMEGGLSRANVIEVLLLHDVGESLIGDQVPSRDETRRQTVRMLELAVARYDDGRPARANGANGGGAQPRISNVIADYEAQEDEAMRVARDLDVFENLVQLEVYRIAGALTDKEAYQDFRADLMRHFRDDTPARALLMAYAAQFIEWIDGHAGAIDPPGEYAAFEVELELRTADEH